MDLTHRFREIDMKRSWNWSLWIGFLFVVAGFLSYTFFAQFPVTRDFPWANFLLFVVGGIFLLVGLVRAFGKPQSYRGKITGSTLAVLSVVVFGFFSYLIFYELRQLPPQPERRALVRKPRLLHCWIRIITRSRLQIFSRGQHRARHQRRRMRCF